MKKLLFLLVAGAVIPAWPAAFLERSGGTPYKWTQGTPVKYLIDQGNLRDASPQINGSTALTLIQNAFSTWAAVPIASGITFTHDTATNGGYTSANINETNYLSYITFDADTGAPSVVGDETIIIFDSDGKIFEDLVGSQSAPYVLGIASPGGFNTSTKTITKGFSILNGNAVTTDTSDYLSVMTHEFGHLQNLAHSQLNWEDYVSGNDSVVPTMFPLLPSDASVTQSLEKDDEYSLAYLYPNAGALAAKGIITGKVLRRNGDGVRGVNVICRNQADPRKDAVSWISDQTEGGEGEFFCGDLSTGSYSIAIETLFLAVNDYSPDPPMVASEFYSGADESFNPNIDSRTSSQTVAAVGGTTVEGKNIILNEDGRLISGKKKTGTFFSSNADFFSDYYGYSDLDYFITVPSGAKSVKFDLAGADADLDIDLFGRCDAEFSEEADQVSTPIVNRSGGAQQAEFVADSVEASESVELNSTSSPALQACTYHLVVVDNSLTADSFDLTATISGAHPTFTVEKGDASVVSDGTGEILVMSRKLSAKDDMFHLTSLVVTDRGEGDFSRITSAKLYVDENGDGAVTDADRLLSTATDLDASNRQMTFSGLSEYFEPDTNESYLVVYTVQSAAGGGVWAMLLLAGLIAGFARTRRKTFVWAAPAALAVFLGVNCGGKKAVFDPTIAGKSAVTVTGQTFGDEINISVKEGPSSVKDFFD